MKKLALAAVLVTTLAACGDAYPDGVKDTYMGSCVQAGGSDARERCECTYDWLQDNVSYEDFRAFDRAVIAGNTDDVPNWVYDAQEACD